MRYLTLGAFVCFVVGVSAAAQAQTADPQMIAPINKFMEAFNKGDMAGAAATHSATADLAIVDEVPPFAWVGAQAFQSWATALDADAKKNGMTEAKVTLRAPTRVETAGTDAYVVVPVVFTFKLKGVAMREAAQMTFVLRKDASGWMIHGWTWTGPRPQKVAGGTAAK
jgi:hypothetical protein